MINQIKIPMHLDWMNRIYYENRGAFEAYCESTSNNYESLFFLKNLKNHQEYILGKREEE